MRAAIFCESADLGGAEVMVLRLTAGLRQRGVEVLVIGPDVRGTFLRNACDQQGLDYLGVTVRSLANIREIRHAIRAIGEWRPDLVHAHLLSATVLTAITCRRLHIPMVATIHEGPAQMAQLWRRAALAWALRQSDAVVAVSAYMKSDVCRTLRLPPTRVQVIANGVPVSSGVPDRIRRELGIAPNAFVVSTVGSGCERKNQIALIEAMAHVGSSVNWHLLIAGREDDATARMRQRIAAHAIEARVHLLGPRLDTEDILAASDAFAMPSYWEGMPLALLEAMAAGLPCVVSHVGGMPEAVSTGVEGFVVAPDDVTALSASLQRLHDDPILRRAMGTRARDRMEREFSETAMTARYLDLYQAALNRRSA